MKETIVTVMGHAVSLRYTVHEGNYIEWYAGIPSSLLSTLLRVHYNEYICAELRRQWFEEQYEQNQINSAQMLLGLEDGEEPVF